MNDVWFTSDTHYGHKSIIEYAKRPYADADEMDEAMIANWNAIVKPGDRVYHLGDFALCSAERATKIAKRLLGQKFLVFGNHDKRLRKDANFLSQWSWTRDLTQVEVDDQKIVLCHYAMRVWAGSHKGTWQLYGHSHGSLKEDPHARSIDVGVDCWSYTPVAFENVRARMSYKTFQPVDHHGRKDDHAD